MDPQFRNRQAFAQLTKNITVNDLLNDFIAIYDINRSLEEVQNDWQIQLGSIDLELEDQISLVRSKGEIVGYINALDIYTPDDPIDNLNLEQFIHPLKSSMIVSCDTSLIDYVLIAGNDEHFAHFVIKANKFVGWVSYNDLNKSAFHLCLFSLFLDLEEKLLYALRKTPKFAFDQLEKDRQNKALGLYGKKFKRFSSITGEPFPPKLLECTMMIDKFEMMTRIPLAVELVPSLEERDNWRLAKKIRDIIAHPSVGEDILEKTQKKDLVPFIGWILKLTNQLVDYCNNQTINQ